MIDVGTGPAVVMIPGIQGRWEWMRPAIDALSRRYRVLSFSLNEATGRSPFDAWDDYIDGLLDRPGIGAAALVGVSFGGLVAAHYAASRPHRVNALVLVSSPPPDWRVGHRQQSYLGRPVLSAIPFAIRGLLRMWPETMAAGATTIERARLLVGHVSRVLRHPASPSLMATWVRAWQDTPAVVDCGAIRAPTLVVTGEPHLDLVVPTSSSLRYLELIAGARHVCIPRTGHIGLVTRPDAFADVVGRFVDAPDNPRPGGQTGSDSRRAG